MAAEEERKVFIPLENNPEVMTQFSRALGLPSSFSFHDIWTLEPELLSSSTDIPRPIHALIFIFPMTLSNETFLRDEESTLPATATTLPSDPSTQPVLWIPQTIGNACGLIALLHTLLNNSLVTGSIPSTSPLHGLRTTALSTAPSQRGALVSNSTLLERLHAQHAVLGSTAPPADPANWHDQQGFVAFVRGDDGHLWELEGRRKGPVDRGVMGGEDMLSPQALARSVGAYLQREKEVRNEDIRFSLIGLAGGPEAARE